MIVKDIEYSKNFCKDLKKLPIEIKKRAIKIERIFKANPLHPSLRLHKLFNLPRPLAAGNRLRGCGGYPPQVPLQRHKYLV